jgi:opacity protein-like surface antigen
MKALLSRIVLICLSLGFGFTALAQIDPCATNLKDAVQKSDEGWYDDAIALINQTLNACELSKNDQIEAYKLLIVNYLAIDNLEKADLSAAKIMKIDPNYEPDLLRDRTEVIVLFQKYKPAAVLKGYLSGGINLSQTTASNTYSMVTHGSEASLDNYQNVTGFQIGLGLEFRLLPKLWIRAGGQYRSSGYSITIPNVQGRTVNYQEEINYFEAPTTIKYYFLERNIQPFVQGGVNLSFLNSALGQLSRDNISDIVSRDNQRNNFYLGYIVGVGVAYNIKGFSLQGGVNYMINPSNLNKENTRYDNIDMVFKYYYLDHNFSMNNLFFNIGLTYNLGYKNILYDTKK